MRTECELRQVAGLDGPSQVTLPPNGSQGVLGEGLSSLLQVAHDLPITEVAGAQLPSRDAGWATRAACASVSEEPCGPPAALATCPPTTCSWMTCCGLNAYIPLKRWIGS